MRPRTPTPPPSTRVEEGDPSTLITNIAIRRADKSRFDRVQAWLSLHEGRPLRQWEVLAFLVDGVWASTLAPLVAPRQGRRGRPKPKRP